MEIIQKHTEFIQFFLQNKNSLGWQKNCQNTAPDFRSTTLLPVVIKTLLKIQRREAHQSVLPMPPKLLVQVS